MCDWPYKHAYCVGLPFNTKGSMHTINQSLKNNI